MVDPLRDALERQSAVKEADESRQEEADGIRDEQKSKLDERFETPLAVDASQREIDVRKQRAYDQDRDDVRRVHSARDEREQGVTDEDQAEREKQKHVQVHEEQQVFDVVAARAQVQDLVHQREDRQQDEHHLRQVIHEGSRQACSAIDADLVAG